MGLPHWMSLLSLTRPDRMPSSHRYAALQQIQRRRPVATAAAAPFDELWASDVFGLQAMK